MSEPKRYRISGLHPHIYEDKEGFMVYYEDYARLKAEVERLTEVIKAQAKGLDEKFGRDVDAKEGKQS